MLVLTRKVGETICIGDNIIIHILGCRGNQSRIGITAPKSVTVDRQEIYAKKQKKPDEKSPIQIAPESDISFKKNQLEKPRKKRSNKCS